MKSLRVLVLTHEDLIPPPSIEGLGAKEIQRFKKEFHVTETLRSLGHQVEVLGVSDDLLPIRERVSGMEPHAVFNLLMEFQDVAIYQAHVTSYLELLRVPYAGCNPRGLFLAKDKALSKQIFRAHRIPTPSFTVVRRGRQVVGARRVPYPSIVKSVDEEASLGIAQASVVHAEGPLRERVAFVHEKVGTDAIVEQYIEGRELTVGVIGNERLRTFPVWETTFANLPDGSEPIATARVKWDLEYQKRVGLDADRAKNLPEGAGPRIARLARRVYRALGLSGYARLDLRLAADGRVWVIEANPNPDLSPDEDFAEAAEESGLPYPKLVERILRLGVGYRSPWRDLP